MFSLSVFKHSIEPKLSSWKAHPNIKATICNHKKFQLNNCHKLQCFPRSHQHTLRDKNVLNFLAQREAYINSKIPFPSTLKSLLCTFLYCFVPFSSSVFTTRTYFVDIDTPYIPYEHGFAAPYSEETNVAAKVQ